MSASIDHAARIARWNKYKSQVDTAGARVIRATQFLVRPLDGFPAYHVEEIKPLWNMWAEQKEIFWRMTSSDAFTPPVFPKMPAIDAEGCCFKMWGLLIQVQIDGTHGSTNFLRETVLQIAASHRCRSHPETCSCHVPDHPWTDKDDMEALAPINPKHRFDCNCAGWRHCAQKEVERAALDEKTLYRAKGFPSEFCKCDMEDEDSCTCGKPEKSNVDKAMLLDASGNLTPEMGEALCGKGWTKILPCEHGYTHCVVCPEPASTLVAASSPYEYKHHVDTCPCGVCHKSRVDSGTQGAYEKKTREAANAVLATLPAICKKECLQRQESYSSTQPLVNIGLALAKADLAIAKASAACGGGADHPDFAKNLFAAMGTPYDSKCPHGLPFYSCMPCSH